MFSLSHDDIIPIDNESSYLLRKIPVLTVKLDSGSTEMGEKTSDALRGYKVVVQPGLRCFAIGQTLEETHHWASALEEECDSILEHKLLGEEIIEYHKYSESYKK